MGFLSKNIAINLAFYCLSVVAQGKCDHYLDDNCVDAYGSATFDFQPLFSEPPRFGYGFRVYQDGEISDSLFGRPIGYKGDVNKVKAWLEFKNETFIVDKNATRSSDFAMLLSNATGEISGGNNGCDGLLGAQCVSNLKDILKWAAVLADKGTTHVFRENVQKFQQTPLTNLSCPGNIFDNFREYNGIQNFDHVPEGLNFAKPEESGNASYPWISDLFYSSAEAHMAFAAIGIVARFNTDGTSSHEDVQLELVCVRPQAVEGSGDRINATAVTAIGTGASPSASAPSGGGSSNLGVEVFSLLLLVAISTALAL